MKKLFILSLVLSSAVSFAQGTFYLQNFSDYKLGTRIVGGSPSNCLPEAVTSMDFDAHSMNIITSYNGAAGYTPGWSVRTTTTGPALYQSIGSGLLTAISPITRWQFLWYTAVDPVTNQTVYDTVNFNMGDPSAFPNCSWGGSTYIDGTYTDAFWFYVASENTTYLIVQ